MIAFVAADCEPLGRQVGNVTATDVVEVDDTEMDA